MAAAHLLCASPLDSSAVDRSTARLPDRDEPFNWPVTGHIGAPRFTFYIVVWLGSVMVNPPTVNDDVLARQLKTAMEAVLRPLPTPTGDEMAQSSGSNKPRRLHEPPARSNARPPPLSGVESIKDGRLLVGRLGMCATTYTAPRLTSQPCLGRQSA